MIERVEEVRVKLEMNGSREEKGERIDHFHVAPWRIMIWGILAFDGI
jgi:hypothetical protein